MEKKIDDLTYTDFLFINDSLDLLKSVVKTGVDKAAADGNWELWKKLSRYVVGAAAIQQKIRSKFE